ncbi:2-phosphosulfolactate phosphatase [Bacteroidia bacterium]|nr:2-phosphosulfolactate phosphatase [Bacteroidia bacterium]MDC1395046.1 2-phosphosulfolactate phosphatase [Bacteroidia bacterium]
MNVETVFSPLLFHQIENIDLKNVVVIDILRATSTITTILKNGASAVIPVSEEAVASSYKSTGYLVGGERGGDTIPGFDFGNSPFHYKSEIVKGKEIVLTTTNGTKCIEMASRANQVIIGSFLNLSAVVDQLKSSGKDIVLFCAGWKDRVNLEDSLFAGAVASAFSSQNLDDASLLAIDAYQAAKDDLFKALKNSNHFHRLASKGVTKDIEYCCKIDVIKNVAILREKKLVLNQ